MRISVVAVTLVRCNILIIRLKLEFPGMNLGTNKKFRCLKYYKFSVFWLLVLLEHPECITIAMGAAHWLAGKHRGINII